MLKKPSPPQRSVWPLVLLMVFIGGGLGVASLVLMREQVKPINGSVPEFQQRKYVLVVEVTPIRTIDPLTAVTITASVDGAMLGPFPYLAEDINRDGKPDRWERLVLTPNHMPYIMLSVTQMSRGFIACWIIDGETGDLIPKGPGNVPYSSRPDPGAVRCYLNRPAR